MEQASAIILAAGKGTRMRSDLPKCAHEVCGRAMVSWVVDACARAGCGRVVVVVGHGRGVVEDAVRREVDAGVDLRFALQAEQLGTGHAVLSARGEMGELASRGGHPVFVLAGDGPLIRAETLRTLLDRHARAGASATLATAVLEDPSGYGRIVRDGGGGFGRIVEQKNATEEELGIREVNPSYYCFDAAALFGALERVGRDGVTGEYYLTDVPALLKEEGGVVEVIDAVPAEDVLSINTPEQLREVERVLSARGRGGRVGVEGS